jgi:hypothetical protein
MRGSMPTALHASRIPTVLPDQQHRALRERLRQQVPALRTQRDPERNLSAPRFGTDEQQTRDVDAGDEQDQRHHRPQRPEHRAHASHDLVEVGPHVGMDAGIAQRGEREKVDDRRNARQDRREVARRVLGRHARPEPADARRVEAAEVVRIAAERHP